MKSLVIYGSNKWGPGRKLVLANPAYYIRIVKSKQDFVSAFSQSKPKLGETLLNTVPIEP